MESVLHDCCGFCPEPKSDDEREVAEEESKIYVSGDVQFMKDDPGRQAIGSFNPLTNDDWTEMAYIGNTQELCQKICEGDVGFVDDWCKANHEGVDRRDHAGRTPLHLAAQCSTPEVVKSLVDNGARIVSRLVDGMTALHIAAARGNVDMVITLLEKSESNEAEEADKEDRKRAEKEASSQSANKRSDNDAAMKDDDEDSDDDSDEDMEDVSSEDDTAMTEGSFVKVADQKRSDEDALDGDDKAKPDFYDVNVLAWDTPVSPLHLAILGGHTEVIKTLISAFGADALLPIKIIDQYSRSPSHAIMTLVIAARLSDPSSYRVVHDLLAHGASSAQVDLHRVSAFHYLVARKKVDLLKACIEEDGAAAKGALNHIVVDPQYWRPQAHSPLTTAIRTGDTMLVNYLLDVGAKAVIDLDSFVAAYTATEEDRPYYIRDRDISELWRDGIAQPIFLAVENDMPDVAMRLLDKGADINTIDGDAYRSVKNFKANDKHHLHGNSVLDTIISKIEALDRAIDKKIELPRPPILQKDSTYLEGKKTGSYAHWYTSKSIEATMNIIAGWKKCISKKVKDEEDRPGKQARLEALKALKARFQDLQYQLKDGGAKTLEELHPNMSRRKDDEEDSSASEDVPIQLAVRFRVSASDEVLEGYSQL